MLPDHSSKLTQPLTTEMFHTADGTGTVDNKSHRADKKTSVSALLKFHVFIYCERINSHPYTLGWVVQRLHHRHWCHELASV